MSNSKRQIELRQLRFIRGKQKRQIQSFINPDLVKYSRECPVCQTSFGAVADHGVCPKCGKRFLSSDPLSAIKMRRVESDTNVPMVTGSEFYQIASQPDSGSVRWFHVPNSENVESSNRFLDNFVEEALNEKELCILSTLLIDPNTFDKRQIRYFGKSWPFHPDLSFTLNRAGASIIVFTDLKAGNLGLFCQFKSAYLKITPAAVAILRDVAGRAFPHFQEQPVS